MTLYESSQFTIKDAWNNGSNHRVYHALHESGTEYIMVNSSIPRLLHADGTKVTSALNPEIMGAILGARYICGTH